MSSRHFNTTKRWGLALLVASSMASGCKDDGATIPAEARAEAREIWDKRCTNCHGERGVGDGPGSKIIAVDPRDLTSPVWQRSVTDEHIRGVIVDGGQSVGLSPLMAANPDLRTKPEVARALVDIVRRLPEGPPLPPPNR